MLVSSSWLKDYVFLPDTLTAQELETVLTEHVVEVEGVFDQAASLDHIVVGKILSVEKHPDADRLNICLVQADEVEPIQIVCGGTNVSQGMLVALGKIGAQVQWHGEGELVTLKKTKIRGVTSLGMICGADEIGLADHFPNGKDTEILDLSATKATPGTPLADVLSFTDLVADIDNKSMTHRPDLWGHYGLARELSVLYRKKFTEINPPKIQEGKDYTLTVHVQDEQACPRYTGVVMDNIEVAPSPQWLQDRLRSVGVEPKNNIVDVTNYVMFDMGQPMHAFDAAKVAQGNDLSLIVRNAEPEETVHSLLDDTLTLSADMTVIASPKEILALAGVVGGQSSAVSNDTTTIILESANFHPVQTRRTSQAVGVRTDSSARFEKSLDPSMCDIALKRAVQLIKDICPTARVASNVADIGTSTVIVEPITVSHAYIEKKLGMSVESKKVQDILTRLGFGVTEKKDVYTVITPSWRATKDVHIKEDIVEEVARIIGYNNIEAIHPRCSIDPAPHDPLKQIQATCRTMLVHEYAMTEMQNYSFVSKEQIEAIHDRVEEYLELDNPVAKDKPYLRRQIISGLLENVEKNQRDVADIALFEIGRTFLAHEPGERATPKGDDLLPQQPTMLGCVIAQKHQDTPFFMASMVARRLLNAFGISATFVPDTTSDTLTHPGRSATIQSNQQVIGRVGEIHPTCAKQLGLERRVAFVELSLDIIESLQQESVTYEPLPLFPSTTRDISLIVSKNVSHDSIVTVAMKGEPLLVSVTLRDMYTGNNVPSDKKNLTYRLTYQSPKETLTAQQVDTLHQAVIARLTKQLDANI